MHKPEHLDFFVRVAQERASI